MIVVEDLDVFLSDFGVPAAVGSEIARVLLDQPDQIVLGNMQISREYAARCKSSAFPNLKNGDLMLISPSGRFAVTADAVITADTALTSDGRSAGVVSYTVKEVIQMNDGAFKQVMLKLKR